MRRRDLIARFREKIAVRATGCHEWQSTIKRDGYGQFWLDGAPRKAHRVAFELFVGPVPPGACVLHRCDNRRCVNPEHLWLGTQQDNVADMDAKQRRGHSGRLTREVAAAIVARYCAGDVSQQCVADEFGVDQTTVSELVLGKRKHRAFASISATTAAA